jgi:hypothetical protein
VRNLVSQQARWLAQQDGSRLGGLVQSGRDIGRVADNRAIQPQAGANLAEDDRPGMDTDPHRHAQSVCTSPSDNMPVPVAIGAERARGI